MPRLGMTKKTRAQYRDCLVCATATNTAHMGVDVCRACTVFYRRSNGKKKAFACRSGTSRCTVGKGLNCKRCRLHHIEQVLKGSVASCGGEEESSVSESSVTNLWYANDTPKLPIDQSFGRDTHGFHDLPPNTSSSLTCTTSNIPELPMLSRVKIAYEKLCFGRLMGEQFARKDPPSPRHLCSADYACPVYPATFGTMNHANRVLVTCILDFGACAFPEFSQLTEEEKWAIAVKYFFTFRMLDNSYRARKRFADIPNRNFIAYTLYLSEDIIDNVFDDFDKEKGNVDEAKRIMLNVCRTKTRKGRAVIDKMNPDAHEFYALLVLLFWATNGTGVRDEITRISDNYSLLISRELHLYYRETLHLVEYATRLGELFSSLPMFEAHDKIKETFQVFRLLDIFSEDSFTYKLTKS
ncbi:hypothetical protein PRIPAC_77045 [Pristionchus pacificus]|uniref:Nuclear receptor n=1 Tax=Pristionchus pacificus TaxID=54126 RepID=A0A2A6CKT3_PRIPA|nr:hypothetical protein PRIPAC_77045 [Pristionchus pacificus]|eukprot:PDM78729.1 nuclear receptor [Pristionchus pacificus]